MQERKTDAQREADDERLLTQAGQGDLKAFEALARRFERPIANFVHRMGGSVERATEVFAESMQKLAGELDSLPLSDRPEVWLFRTARALLAAQALQDTREISPRTLSSALPDLEEEAAKTTPSSIRDRIGPWARDALLSLPRSRREALVLKVYQGLPYKDIARITGVPAGTVYYWVHISLSEIASRM
ncbi:MAG: sigma-70 family RNA polymerase sigma factor [Planctomycetes bacterium]|nr:sigma-70 family RNA polymerase sigma factor [Planctomycetota bacterium]